MAILGAVAIVVIGIIVFRLWFLQVLSGQQYVAEANDNRLRSVKIVAPRGRIVDRTGSVVVDNRPGLAVGIRPMDVPDGQMGKVVGRLSQTLAVPAWRIRRQLAEHADAPGYDLVVVAEDASRRKISSILEHKQAFPGVEVRKSFLRDYPFGELAAHVLGYTGEISRDELKQARFHSYESGDVIGKAGVEYTYDRWLRGVDGSARVEVDALNQPKRAVAGGRMFEPGDNLVLSLDMRVQQAAEKAIRYGIGLAHQNDARAADGGAAVVLDARTGELIALASYPTYDPAVWVGGMSKRDYRRLTDKAANLPLFDRAVQGEYAIGSTFKVVDAVAGLEEGVIGPSTTFDCSGTFKESGSTWRCWIYPDGHGTVGLTTALAESCDVYFYNVGKAFFYSKGTALEDWAMKLGMGRVTGLDVPGEAAGLVPTPRWRKETFDDPIDKLWKPGNSINLAIGQGDLLATPLQAAVLYAAIANGGTVVRPHLGLRVVDSQGRVVQRIAPPPARKLDVREATLEAVRRGLTMAASSDIGTSAAVFADYKVPVAGKTGTSEVFGKGDYAWYASFAPAQDPKYVVVVMIEQGGHGGSAAAPAARMIYDALFHVQTPRAVGTTHSD